ncbi:hypothetical protein CYMTET_5266 [Cymbomonas tetramitiformis]|uniref:Glutathione S-transferase n=1 Tax=Cymbomonas tetramitiformis TaxID=36881 RepID=A0AAE0GZF0_9CHLO|nr:hypothetical protein CYMTET_5266 [Cymbomonas tetramitiformis]
MLELDALSCIRIEVLTFPDLKKPAYLKDVNPMGTSPAFTSGVDGLRLFESGAILCHLLEVYDTKHEMHPAVGSAQRPVYLQNIFYVLTTVYPTVTQLFLHLLKPVDQQDQTFLASARTKWKDYIAPTLVLELGEKLFLLGDNLSAADLLLGKPLNNANDLGLLDAFPTLKAFFDRVSIRPSFEMAYSADSKF